MKKLLISLALCSVISAKAVVLINVSALPNVSVPGGANWLIMFTQPGVTNYNMTITQFETWLANDTNFLNVLSTNLNVAGLSTNWPTQTYSGNVVWTNTTCFTNVGVNFTSSSVFNPSPIYKASLMISNSAATSITNTLPFTAYSLSLGTNVTQAVVLPGSVLELQYTYYNGIYYVKDYGKNNSTLAQLAGSTNSGAVYFTNGVITIR